MTVYLTPWSTSRNLLREAENLYDTAGTFNCIAKGDLVAIKLHVGELGNPNYVQPVFVHDIVRRVREAGGKPFLTDASTYYRANRNNAYDHMQNALMNGFGMAPFIVADGLRGENVAQPVLRPLFELPRAFRRPGRAVAPHGQPGPA